MLPELKTKLKNLFQRKQSKIDERIESLERKVKLLKDEIWYFDVEFKSKGYKNLDETFAKLSCWNRELDLKDIDLESKIMTLDQRQSDLKDRLGNLEKDFELYGTITQKPVKMGRSGKNEGNKSPIRRTRRVRR
jgi:predicted  nucleic acid-binding Zn-ribbon protein